MALAERLQLAWYGKGRVPWWCWPLSWLYGLLSGLRRLLYRLHVLPSVRLPVPVIVVGNISIGGTGKTPLTLALVEYLQARGLKPGVVSRGYGGQQREALLLAAQPDPAQVGDEPALIRAGGVPVAVGRDRPAAAKLLLASGCDVLIADDGLQHYRLARDVEICVIDGARRFGNAHLLPAGPLREPLRRLRSIPLRVCNGAPARAEEFSMQLRGGQARRLCDGQLRALQEFAGQPLHAMAAIGHPQRFFDSLRAQGLQAQTHAFADHHAFAPQDLAFADQQTLLMTEKDAIKCQAWAQTDWWAVPVRAHLPPAFFEALLARLPPPR